MRCLIVGTAKTGTTALLYGVAQAMGAQTVVHMEERIAPRQPLPPQLAAKVILEHERADELAAFGAGFDRRVLLVRDPRDNLVSRLLYTAGTQRELLDDPAYLRTFATLLQRKQREPAKLPLLQLPPLGRPSVFLSKTCAANRALADFAATAAAAEHGQWFILRYEDLVAGRLEALSAYLGVTVQGGASVAAEYQRVARTKGAGDWRHWFTDDDVVCFRPLLAPLMAALGYPDDWTLAPAPQIAPEHSWQYFERLVRERRQHYGLAPLDLPAPEQQRAPRRGRISKGDIVNRLIRQFGFKSYLEYNKFDGDSYYADIVCDSKAIAYLPEHSYLDAVNLPRLLRLAAGVAPQDLLPLPQLLERYAGQRFDLIFFDPVHVRPDVDLVLRALPALLNPGGVLVVHDCNPEREELTSVKRRHGAWVGETYKAFALLRHYNRGRAITVSEDFGVGLIWNNGLVLDYPLEADIGYQQFAAQREEYIGLINYQQLLIKSARGAIAELFEQPPAAAPARFLPGAAMPSATRLEAQLFWRRHDHDFAEQRTVNLPLLQDGDTQELCFTLPPGAAGVEQLRFDIADAVVALRLDGMELLNPSGALMWRWDADGHAEQDWRDVRFCRADGGLFLLCTSADPRFYPALPASIRGHIGAGWRLVARLAPQPPLVGRLLAELARAQQAAAVASVQARSQPII